MLELSLSGRGLIIAAIQDGRKGPAVFSLGLF